MRTVNYGYGDASWSDLLTSIDGQSLTTDALGNLLSDGTWAYTWQHGRQLAGMSKSGTNIAYGYDSDGKRISKTVNGTTHNYHYLGDQLVELTWGGNKLHFTYDSTGPLSVNCNGTEYFYVKNAQGDVTGLVTTSGTRVVTYTYDAWGNPLSTTGSMAATLGEQNPLRYRGYVYDTETGLYYLQSRYYNPTWGRFINADSVLAIGAEISTYNAFAYCGNNPTIHSDKSGMWFGLDDLIAGVVGGVVGLVSQLASDVATSALTGSWKMSNWQTYAGAFAGGVVGGISSLYVGPAAGGAICAGVSTIVGQTLENHTRGGKKRTGAEIAMNTIVDFSLAGGVAKILPIKIDGITAGRNSMHATFAAGLSKIGNKVAGRMSWNVIRKGVISEIAGSLNVTGLNTIKNSFNEFMARRNGSSVRTPDGVLSWCFPAG